MQVLVIFITGLFAVARFGFYIEALDPNDAADDSSNYGILGERIYYETTVIPGLTDSVPSSGDGAEHSYSDLLIPKPIVSGPLFDNSSSMLNSSIVEELMRKKHQKRADTKEKGLTFQMKKQLLELHNVYRGKVTPSAGDMSYLEWDDDLEKLAQIWADECKFTHYVPVNEKYPSGTPVGQNLYEGDDSTGLLGLHMWFEEYIYYDLRKTKCQTGKECGHFVQMAWAGTYKLGCAKKKCGAMRHMFVCHYFPQAIRQTQMYTVAKPCSSCEPGMLCARNLCMSPEQCENNPFDCQSAKCELECLNCGRLNEEKCTCECMDGWDAPDCSHACVNNHDRCGKNPGFPNKASCKMNNNLVRNRFCRKMCEKCFAVDSTTAPNNTCCDGKVCDFGFVLNENCECKLLCPGPLCDSEEIGLYKTAQAVLNNNAITMVGMPVFALWTFEVTLFYKLRKLCENI